MKLACKLYKASTIPYNSETKGGVQWWLIAKVFCKKFFFCKNKGFYLFLTPTIKMTWMGTDKMKHRINKTSLQRVLRLPTTMKTTPATTYWQTWMIPFLPRIYLQCRLECVLAASCAVNKPPIYMSWYSSLMHWPLLTFPDNPIWIIFKKLMFHSFVSSPIDKPMLHSVKVVSQIVL